MANELDGRHKELRGASEPLVWVVLCCPDSLCLCCTTPEIWLIWYGMALALAVLVLNNIVLYSTSISSGCACTHSGLDE